MGYTHSRRAVHEELVDAPGLVECQLAARRVGYGVGEDRPLVAHLGVVLHRHQEMAVTAGPEDAAAGTDGCSAVEEAA